MLEIDIHTSLLWMTAIIILSLDLIIYIGSNNISSRIFCIFSVVVAFWSISYGFFVSINESTIPLMLIKINHSLGIIATIGFIWFSHSYPNNIKITRFVIISSTIFGILYCSLILFTNSIISGLSNIPLPDRWSWNPGILYSTYVFIFLTCWIYILYKISKSKLLAKSKFEYINSTFMFWGLFLGITPPLILNIILPAVGIYGISWSGPIFSAIWVFVIGYSIMKYRQMNVKIIITEVLAVSMTTIFFLNIFIKAQFGTLENVATFLVFLLIAIYLIRTVLSEAKVKEQLRLLNVTLEDRVMAQTTEIRRAFEQEKHAKRELEKLNDTKNQFIMITQHSIRTPLQHLKNGIEKILSKHNHKDEVDYKILTDNMKRLSTVTNDFLNIANIDNNKNLLETERFDILAQVEAVVTELDFEINQKSLTVEIDRNPPSWPRIVGDKNKIYESLVIVIENAIKYNRHKGQIGISAISNENEIQISIVDTGIGISTEDLSKINQNHFYRGEKAKLQNPIGMGIGLSVARAVIRAHHGNLTICSSGINKGTTIIINLPINYWKSDFEML